MKKVFFTALFLLSLPGCFSLRDEYAFRASLYMKGYNQLPYVQKVRAIDNLEQLEDETGRSHVAKVEHEVEQGSFLFVAPQQY